MNNRRHHRGPAATALAAVGVVVLLLAFWSVLGPSTLGGPFTYVFVRGNSMEPALHGQDLVLLRSRSSYDVGDVVAYRHPDLGNVLHRIVANEHGRFTLKGDNRPDTDSYEPTREDVIGAMWVAVPGATPVIEVLQSPRSAVLLAAAVGALMVGNRGGRKQPPLRGGRRQRAGPSGTARNGGDGRGHRGGGGSPMGALSVFAPLGGSLLGLLALLVAGAFALPRAIDPAATTAATDLRSYTERSAFAYERGIPGGVYDDDRLAAPLPLFRRLANSLPVSFEYELLSTSSDAELTAASGTLQLSAEVRRSNGWVRTVALRPPLDFVGTHPTIETLLDVHATDALIEVLEEATSVDAGTYTLRVVAEVEADAELAGQPFHRAHEQSIEFYVSDLEVELSLGASELVREDSGAVSIVTAHPAVQTLPIVGYDVPNAATPAIARVMYLIAAIGAVVVAVASALTWRGAEPARIRARYGALLVPAALSEHTPASRTVTLGSFAHLARIAEQEGQLVLVEPGVRGGTQYRAVSGDVLYRYHSGAGQPEDDAAYGIGPDIEGEPPRPPRRPSGWPGPYDGWSIAPRRTADDGPPPSAIPPLRQQ